MKKRKRFFKYFLIFIGITLIIDLFIVIFIDKDFFSYQSSETREGAVQSFNENEALEKLQAYRVTQQLHSPEISPGKTIKEVYKLKGQIPAVKNIGWFTEKTDTSGVYIVGYRQTISGSLQEPRWEVSKDRIRAINGKAITITPEFGPESWN